ncbi:hypothetical protein FPRO06_12031 [Fusarium proliferatum]|nr:hypothetical protein FPRO06_12031 [Fusarium proliferatum]
MRSTPLFLLFPVVSLASWLPVKPMQASGEDECTSTTRILPPITQIRIYPTSTRVAIGCQAQATGGSSLIYTTAVPATNLHGPDIHTHTVTSHCDETQCQRPASGSCTPGSIVTTVVCHTCGEKPITTTLTLPIETVPKIQGPSLESVAYTAIQRHPGSPESLESSIPPAGTSLQTTMAGAPHSIPTGAEGGSDSSTVPIPVSPTTTNVVAVGNAPENKVTTSTLLKVVAFAIILSLPLYA